MRIYPRQSTTRKVTRYDWLFMSTYFRYTSGGVIVRYRGRELGAIGCSADGRIQTVEGYSIRWQDLTIRKGTMEACYPDLKANLLDLAIA